MAGFAQAFKDEIRRLARKEVRSDGAALRSASARYRKEIAELKRTLKLQERRIRALEKQAGRTIRSGGDAADSAGTPRFSPDWVARHREKLEMSAADYAELVGVSMLTIYNWEKGRSRPRQAQLEAWGKIRALGKREAWKRLEEAG